MFGTMIGDIVGSRWESRRIKTKAFPLFSELNAITDDSILTVAVADALFNDLDPAVAMRDWARRVKPGRDVGGCHSQCGITWRRCRYPGRDCRSVCRDALGHSR